MRRRTLGAVLALVCALSTRAAAQSRLGEDVPLALRPTDELQSLVREVARTLALRMPVGVSVGDPPPPEILEAVPIGHMAIARDEDGRVLLVLAGPDGQIYRSHVSIGRGRGQDAVRAVALAVEALRDAALDGPPPGSPEVTRRTFARDGHEVTWIYREREGGLFGLPRAPELQATPSIYVGAVAGLSTEYLTALLGPRIGLGLCLHETCLVIESDVPILTHERTACDGRQIEYRPIGLAVRLVLRPFSIDDVVFFAFGLGLSSRFGLARLPGLEVSRLSTDLGIRGGIEIAWRFAPPIELALEVGGDVHVSPARYERLSRPAPSASCPTVETVFIEDIVTLWSTLIVRFRT